MSPMIDERKRKKISKKLIEFSSFRQLSKFITKLFEIYMDLQFTYLEINPLVVTTKSIYILDLASRLDQTADYLCASKWGKIEFPPPFGRDAYAEVRKNNHFEEKQFSSIYF